MGNVKGGKRMQRAVGIHPLPPEMGSPWAWLCRWAPGERLPWSSEQPRFSRLDRAHGRYGVFLTTFHGECAGSTDDESHDRWIASIYFQGKEENDTNVLSKLGIKTHYWGDLLAVQRFQTPCPPNKELWTWSLVETKIPYMLYGTAKEKEIIHKVK